MPLHFNHIRYSRSYLGGNLCHKIQDLRLNDLEDDGKNQNTKLSV
jgi:hypothetical protein